MASKARSNKLVLDDLVGGSFTITNGGIYGSMMSTPLLNFPQTGILGIGRGRFLRQVEREQSERVHRGPHRHRDDGDAVHARPIHGVFEWSGFATHLEHGLFAVHDGLRERSSARSFCVLEGIDL